MRPERPAEAGDDAALIARTAEGDRQAFATLFRRYKGPVFRFARHMGSSHETAEDVTQEVFIILMGTCARFDPRMGPLRTYLYGIARNLLRRRFRREMAHPEVEFDPLDDTAPAATTARDVLGDIERAESLEQLRRAVRSLPAPYREVVVLCDLHEVRYEDAARVVGCPVGTIRSRLSRARRLLAERCRVEPSAPAADGARCLAGRGVAWPMPDGRSIT